MFFAHAASWDAVGLHRSHTGCFESNYGALSSPSACLFWQLQQLLASQLLASYQPANCQLPASQQPAANQLPASQPLASCHPASCHPAICTVANCQPARCQPANWQLTKPDQPAASEQLPASQWLPWRGGRGSSWAGSD